MIEHVHTVKRTIYRAVCPGCLKEDIRTEHPPRERHCPDCNTWYAFVEESWTGPDTFGAKR